MCDLFLRKLLSSCVFGRRVEETRHRPVIADGFDGSLDPSLRKGGGQCVSVVIADILGVDFGLGLSYIETSVSSDVHEGLCLCNKIRVEWNA